MTRRFRGPSTIGIAVVVALVQLVGTHFAGLRQPDRHALDALGFALLLAGPALLLLRRRLPGPMAAGAAAVAAAYLLLGYPWGPFSLSLVLALVFAVLARARWWAWGSVAGLALLLAVLWLASGISEGVIGLAWLIVVVLLAELGRVRIERRAERRRALVEEQRRARDEERLMLARDIHDVVAHSLSMINVQASVALHLAEKNPEQLKPALEAIKKASKDSLAEVREVLGQLRQDVPRSPSLQLAQLPELVERAGRSGLQITLERPLPAGLDPQVESAAFRTVQEALTNVVRHAQARTVRVAVRQQGQALAVTVIDDGVGLGGASEGNGLRGMRERLGSLGGSLEIVDLADGTRTGTKVHAQIPLGTSAGDNNSEGAAQ
ncbi:two component system sensor kinase [Arthrobacter crystallopoietes BAB-32]|uniref:Two component system sensor kinase n=1 Tax=Arthrobacter crystallopoietes BAB-32 TaxID=1246476 RepID=N1UTJ4_9MICC|nr:sensor histidine kinase [Arthrobacter crystallopoietes]EMY32375.1 two component system sensor kinase [Arthrobacter crystallopoietes BAB-32]